MLKLSDFSNLDNISYINDCNNYIGFPNNFLIGYEEFDDNVNSIDEITIKYKKNQAGVSDLLLKFQYLA